MPVWHTAYPQLWDRKRKRSKCKCQTLCSSIKHLSGMWGMREWERKPEREGCLSLSLQSPTWQVFTETCRCTSESLQYFLSSFLWPSWTRPWRDFIAGGQSVCCETWYPAPYSCETIWSIFRAQYGICLKPLYLKSLHALELMYSLFSYQLQHLPFWMAISVKRPEMRLKMLSGLVNVCAYVFV